MRLGWVTGLVLLGLVGCDDSSPECSGTGPIDSVAVAGVTGTVTRTGAPAVVSVRLLAAPSAPVEIRHNARPDLVYSAASLRFEAGERGPKTFEVRLADGFSGDSWSLGFEVATGSADEAFACVAMTPVFGPVRQGGCGDGIVQVGEGCDDGEDNGDDRCAYGLTSCTYCSSLTCQLVPGTPSYCGDGVVDRSNAGDEQCDGAEPLDCGRPLGAITGFALGETRCEDCRWVNRCTWYGDCDGVTGPCITLPPTDPGTQRHSCVLEAGVPRCFGDNHFGQSRPPAMAPLTYVGVGAKHSCGLHADGRVTCWGDDAYGKLTPSTSAPFSSIVVLSEETCGLTRDDGRVSCWGRADTHIVAMPEGGGYTKLVGSGYIACAVTAEGGLRCGGIVASPAPERALVSIASVGGVVCGLDETGARHCWGHGGGSTPVTGLRDLRVEGELFCATSEEGKVCWVSPEGEPASFPSRPSYSTTSATSERGTCTRASSGELSCEAPGCAPPSGSYAGVGWLEESVCGVTERGIAWCRECAPLDARGAPRGGPGPTLQSSRNIGGGCSLDRAGVLRCRNVSNDIVLGAFVEVAAGEGVACARDELGHTICFGPHAVAPPAMLRATALGATHRVACAVTSTGTLQCWGDPEGFDRLLTPPEGDGFVDVALGDRHGCALTTTGTLRCWGYESRSEASPPDELRLAVLVHGSCGLDTAGDFVCWDENTPRFDEVRCWDEGCVVMNDNAYAPTRGYRAHTYDLLPRSFGLITDHCRVSTDGALFFNSNAPIGECNSGVSSTSGIGRPTAEPITAIASSRSEMYGQVLCGIVPRGETFMDTLWCWGEGYSELLDHPQMESGDFFSLSMSDNQLCTLDGAGMPRCFPDGVTPAPPALAFSRIASGLGQTCGILAADGSVRCWGTGAGSATPLSGAFVDLTLGGTMGCARRASGEVMCWGSSTTRAEDPPDILLASIGASDDFVCGVDMEGALRCWGGYAWNL